jgi:hypothetical protein
MMEMWRILWRQKRWCGIRDLMERVWGSVIVRLGEAFRVSSHCKLVILQRILNHTNWAVFWEQQTGLLPNQQKIQITRSPEATQPAFDKHMEGIRLKYGATHIINLLSETKPGEVELSSRYIHHIKQSALLNNGGRHGESSLLKSTEFDFHAETKGPGGFEAANMIRHSIEASADSFSFFLMESDSVRAHGQSRDDKGAHKAGKQLEADSVILQQEGIFRTNCLDCLDRTNLVQGIVSRMGLEVFLQYLNHNVGQEFWMRHSTLWADNGDALSKIYAGTGALKSSFTRTGRMSLAGAIADARKSATRIYINNFADKDRQNTIDILLVGPPRCWVLEYNF